MVDKPGNQHIGRRKVLKATGLITAMGLAGCQGESNNDSTTNPTTTNPTTTTTQKSDTKETTTSTEQQRPQGGKLTYAIAGQSQQLHPMLAATPATMQALRPMFKGLTIIENDLQPHPWLATDWSIDGTTYTFNLREGVMFHPPVDREMTADDVVATYEYIKNNESTTMYNTFQRFEGFEAPDDHTVEVHLKEPFTYTLMLLGELPTSIHPADYIEKQTDHPVGTGPFKFKERAVGSYHRMTAFEDWWGDERPYVDEVEQRPIPEASVRLQELKTGNADFVATISGKDVSKIQNDENLELQLRKGVKTEIFSFNTNVEPFGDPRVRKAIRHAVDDQAALDLSAFGLGSPTDRPFYRYEDYVPDDPPVGQDFQKAKSLLEDAGYGDGFDFTVKVVTAWQRSGRAAVAIKQWLSQLGVNMDIQRTTVSDWYGNVFFGEKFEATLYGYTGTPDGVYVNMSDLYHSDGIVNIGYYENEQMDEYVNQITRLPNGEERKKVTKQAIQLAWEDVPKFCIYHHHFPAAKRSYVGNDLYWGATNLRVWRNWISDK